MKRLTHKTEDGKAFFYGTYTKTKTLTDTQGRTFGEVADKLAHYEDLEEAGRLVVLPCKVGDTVWVYYSMQNEIEEKTIWEIVIGSKHDTLIFTDSMQFTVWDKDWAIAGRFLFHTLEEAEAALKGGDLDART